MRTGGVRYNWRMTPEQQYDVGDTFNAHLVWRLPNDDYVRAIFAAEVLDVIDGAMKYLVRLDRFVAGRQESAGGEIRPKEALDHAYWQHVVDLVGHRCTLAWEVADGAPVYLRVATLTGEHDFFHRYDQSPGDLDLDRYGHVVDRIRRQFALTDAEEEGEGGDSAES